MKKGRPSKYSEEIADAICEQVATTSKGLRAICKEVGVDYVTVKQWLLKNPEFRTQYALSKEEQSDHMADEIISIADDSSQDEIETEDGRVIANHEFINRARLRVDARKWIASKLKPKKYGDKVDVTSAGEKLQQPIQVIVQSEQVKKDVESLK